MKEGAITVLTVAILYVLGYSAKQRAHGAAFYGRWKCGKQRLTFRYHGVCDVHGTYGVLSTYESEETKHGIRYTLYIQYRKEPGEVLNVYVEDQKLYYASHAYVKQ